MTGGATARRKLAFDLGVDPNTSFAPLGAELKRLATASAVGETGVNVGLSFVAGRRVLPSAPAAPATRYGRCSATRLRAELERDGRVILAGMGVCPPDNGGVLRQPDAVPTDKAIIVEAMQSLGGAGGREVFIAGAANASRSRWGSSIGGAELIASFNRKVAPVRGFAQLGGAPMLETGKGTVSILPSTI